MYVVVFAVYPFAKKAVSTSEYSKTFNPWNDCSWSGHVYDGCATWITTNSKRNTYNVFKTDIYVCADTWYCRGNFVLTLGLLYLESRRKKAKATGEGYFGFNDGNTEMAASLQVEQKDMPLLKSLEITRAQQVIAFIPLVLVGVMNKVLLS